MGQLLKNSSVVSLLNQQWALEFNTAYKMKTTKGQKVLHLY